MKKEAGTAAGKSKLNKELQATKPGYLQDTEKYNPQNIKEVPVMFIGPKLVPVGDQ